ncbi:MAG: hypothetical protein IIY36_05035, partial [Lachnospiraceae bacterium]|nr:hypothetical protein [Lachnospiraceae bacterium]
MMTNVIKMLIAIVVIALISLLQNKLNCKKRYRRIRQLPLILVALAVVIFGIVMSVRFLTTIEGLEEQALQAVGRFDAARNIIQFLKELIAQWSLFIMNIGIMLLFVIVKAVVRPIVSRVCRDHDLLETFSLSFYYFDEDREEWFLREQMVNFRNVVFAVCVGLTLASGVYLGAAWAFGPEHAIWALVFPCAAAAVMNELYGYISGQTKEEYENSVFGDISTSQRISNYYKLRGVLEEQFPEPLLSSHSGCEFINRKTAVDVLRELEDSEDTADRVAAEYFLMNDRFKTADTDCVRATQDLLHRRNVVFYNPFYRDLGLYITLPLAYTLLSGKKCVVLCGRRNTADDVRMWLADLLEDYTHTRSLWGVSTLSEKEPDCEVGILTFDQIYEKSVIVANQPFFRDTDLVLLIEPSIMLNTSQIALSILAEEMSFRKEKPVYCICDRFTDGLVDTLSHVLRSEITDVVAAPVPRCDYAAMAWDSDGDFYRQQMFDKQTRYLGNGVELAAVAVKNQVPEVTWYGETKVPIRDIKWIAGQHFTTICRYMNQPTQQNSLYEKIKFVSLLWSAEKQKEQLLIAEDEFCNLFNTMRAYLSRGIDQIFVNIFSENYLLRDYLRCNRQMFLSNPNAVPSCVPDYAKTERNTILKLVIMASLRPISEEEIIAELHLAGLDTDDVYGTMETLLAKYTYAAPDIFTVRSEKLTLDEFTTITEDYYSISEDVFERYFEKSLKNAYYILEEEEEEDSYINASLFSHVTQTILPGQFATYDGKYYQAKYVSPKTGVILRRAADLYDGRKYYRQVRKYFVDASDEPEIISRKKVMDIEFVEMRADIRVETSGYLEMRDNHDLRTARLVDLSEDPSVGDLTRSYRHKTVLRIQLPEADADVCFTFCMLLSEIFRSVFPDGWAYLAAVTKRTEDAEGFLNYLVYPAEGGIEDGYIYIIEDSDIDLGLLEAVERNFRKLMEIMTDFLEWHFEKMREPAHEDPVPVRIEVAEEAAKKRRTLIGRLLDRIRRLFGGKKDEPVVVVRTAAGKPAADKPTEETQTGESAEKPVTGMTDAPAVPETAAGDAAVGDESAESVPGEAAPEEAAPEEAETPAETAPVKAAPVEAEALVTEDPELVHVDDTDIFDEDEDPEISGYLEEQFEEMGLLPLKETRYQKECYLKYGFDEIDERIHIDELRRYLRVRGWGRNALTLARKREIDPKTFLDLNAENHCDFCGLPLTGVSFDRLNDGRVRCNDCSASAITTVEEFSEIFHECQRRMEEIYGIKYRVPVRVKVTDAREVNKGAGRIFRPSKEFASRVLGFAQHR